MKKIILFLLSIPFVSADPGVWNGVSMLHGHSHGNEFGFVFYLGTLVLFLVGFYLVKLFRNSLKVD